MNALIVDDDKHPARLLKELVEEYCPEISHVQVILDPEEAVAQLRSQNMDLLFLDVEMPRMDGFALLQSLPKERIPPVIFTTGHQHYALRAFQVEAIHFLLKPINPEQLMEAVARAKRQTQQGTSELVSALQKISAQKSPSELLSLPDGADYHVVSPEDIIRIEGKGSYSTFFLTDGRSILVSKRIRVYVNKLGSENFMKPHQSHLVNKQQIARFNKSDGGFLEMKDGSIVPVSNGLRPQVKAALGL